MLTYQYKPMESESRRRASCGGRKSSFTLLEFFLTLVRLRRGIDLRLIGDLYGVFESTVSGIFKTMINYMYLHLYMLPIWPNPEHVSAHLPLFFRELYPSTFIVISRSRTVAAACKSDFLLRLLYGRSCIERTDVQFLHAYSALCRLLIIAQLLHISLSHIEACPKSRKSVHKPRLLCKT